MKTNNIENREKRFDIDYTGKKENRFEMWEKI